MSELRSALEPLRAESLTVLVRAREADPEAFERAGPVLVEAARIHSIGDLQRVVAQWREGTERERSLGEDRLRARRSLHASVSFEGMVRVDGDLDPAAGESLLTALGAVLDAEARGRPGDDDRSPAQRRADALGESAASGSIAPIARAWVGSART